MKKFIYIAILFIVSAMSVTACTEQEVKPRDGGAGGGAMDPKGQFNSNISSMKTKLIIVLIASEVLVSFGASRITKAPSKKAELHATSSTTTTPIGGLGAEDR